MTLIPSPAELIVDQQGRMSPAWRRFLSQVGSSANASTPAAPTVTLGDVIGLNGINVSGDLASGLKVRLTGSLQNISGIDLTDLADGDTLIYDEASATWAPGSGSGATVSDTAPASPRNGQEWVDTTDGTFYIYYDDGTSAAWVAFGTAGGGGAAANITYDHTTSGLTATDVQAAIDELAASGGGGPTPTGTGFRHVTAGVEDAAAVALGTAANTTAAAGVGITFGSPVADAALLVGAFVDIPVTKGYTLDGPWQLKVYPSGSITIDVRRATFPVDPTASIFTSGAPAVASSTSNSGTAVYSTASLAIGDMLRLYVSANSGIKWLSLLLNGTRT